MAGLLLELRRQVARNRRMQSSHGVAKQNSLHQGNTEPPASETDKAVQDSQGHAARENIFERTQSIVERDDILLRQIDEFRERAKQLQDMLNVREVKAEELQGIVEEREEKAEALDQILRERQEQVDAIGTEVERHIDNLIASVSVKMEEIEISVRESLTENGKLGQEQAEELKEVLSQIQEQLGQAKSDLSEKIHSENVKCYRNIQDLFKSMDEKLDRLENVETRLRSTHRTAIAALVFAIVNLFGIAAAIVLQLGFFGF